MAEYYKNSEILNIHGYEVYFTRFSDSIIKDHFQDAARELTEILENFRIDESQIIQGGGGLSTITQTLRDLLYKENWKKEIIESKQHINRTISTGGSAKILTSESHEVDHYKEFSQGTVGLEIEWNNKDPFYDRDLENFRKLHQIGEISFGIIITRGASLQAELFEVYKRFIAREYPFKLQANSISFSDKAKKKIEEFMKMAKAEAINNMARMMYTSKYGTATTHINKLFERINRGLGNPCPLILIGIGKERLIFNEKLQTGQTLSNAILSLGLQTDEFNKE
jgi:hypothetical protein